jgi:hypothetical protein
MQHRITLRSPGSIALGALFALGTCYVLFSDVRSPAEITVDHVMTLLVLVGTIASGHMFWHQALAWRVLPAAGLAVLFLAGTFYCVTTSAARNAEQGLAKVGEVQSDNEARQRLERDLAEAKEDLRRQRASQTTECASGAGPRCAGRTKLADAAASHVEVLEGRLAKAKPRQIENAGLKHAAKVFAALPWVAAGEQAIERALILFGPFVKALFLEIATIVFLGIGLGHEPRPMQRTGAIMQRDELASLRAKFFAPDPPPAPSPPKGPRRTPKRPDNVVAFKAKHPVITALEQAGRPVSNRELARLMQVSEGEASKRWQEVAGELLVCRQGKHLQLSLRRSVAIA